MKTNVLGTVELVRAVLPSMIDRQEGRIVLVCSQAGQVRNIKIIRLHFTAIMT